MRRVLVALALVSLAGCGGDGKTPAAITTASAVLPAVPDASGLPVAPQASGSNRAAKAWVVPDAAGTTDWVSADDVRFLAVARPAVPYATAERTISNATLIAMGEGACAEATSYSAGGATVTGEAAAAVHRAAVPVYC